MANGPFLQNWVSTLARDLMMFDIMCNIAFVGTRVDEGRGGDPCGRPSWPFCPYRSVKNLQARGVHDASRDAHKGPYGRTRAASLIFHISNQAMDGLESASRRDTERGIVRTCVHRLPHVVAVVRCARRRAR